MFSSDVNKREVRQKLSRFGIVKYQLITHCFLHDIPLSMSDIECLALLSITGESKLNEFCTLVMERKIFKSEQAARNCLNRAEKLDLISKEGKNKKLIAIRPWLNLESEGNILVDYKFLSLESEEV